MAKAAKIEFFWTPSPSVDIDHVDVVYTVNGSESRVTLPSTTRTYSLESTVPANSSVTFRVDTVDTEGSIAMSETHSFTLGDLEEPLPATDLGHRVLEIVDSEVPAPPPPPPQTVTRKR